jgi:hypothetical protein
MQTKQCRDCSNSFYLQDFDFEILEKANYFGREEYKFPVFELCFECRMNRLLAFRNHRKLYKRNDGMISNYSDRHPFNILSREDWWSDEHDPRIYGQEFDFSRTFFEQFYELNQKTPKVNLLNIDQENSDFCNFTAGNKNCYMVIGGDFNQDCFYSVFNMNSSDVAESYLIEKCQLSYGLVYSANCYNVKFAKNSFNCSESWFLSDCLSLKDCIGCVGLNNKQYCIFNVQYSKEEYEAQLAGFGFNSRDNIEKFKKLFEAFKVTVPHRATFQVNSELCVGDRIRNSKNCYFSFDVNEAEDIAYCLGIGWKSKNLYYSIYSGHLSQNLYNCMGILNSNYVAFSTYAWNSQYIFYSDSVHNSQNLFGCSEMKNAEYCILNKQYTKEEYESLLPKIIEHMKRTGEWGSFMPLEYSKFAYNETVAMDLFPKTQAEVLSKGGRWLDLQETVDFKELEFVPDKLADISTELENHIFKCGSCSKGFKFIKQELQFYQKINMVLPNDCFDCRHKKILQQWNGVGLWQKQCDKCQVGIWTSISPDRPEKVYCEKCYLAEAY